MSELTLRQKYTNLSVGSEIFRHSDIISIFSKTHKAITDASASDKLLATEQTLECSLKYSDIQTIFLASLASGHSEKIFTIS